MNDFESNVTVAAAIIVKNEERCIARCIDSLLPLFQEIIVVDTGSTDNTLKILNGYLADGVKIFHTEWEDSFSKPRNLAISKSISNYIFFVDADEYVVSSKHEVSKIFVKININNNRDLVAICPKIKNHDGDISKNIRRGFANNGGFFYFGYVHEELRRKDKNRIIDISVDIIINHDGYTHDVLKAKGKYNRNKRLNLKNLSKEPLYLRWKFFYYRDCFEGTPPDEIYKGLAKAIKCEELEPLSRTNIKMEAYTFSILDLMAKAKLSMMDNDNEFYEVIELMDAIIPYNSNGFYYKLIYELFKWKCKCRVSIKEIIEYKRKNKKVHEGMVHSEGLHIDAALSFYLNEIGMVKQARKLLLSVRDNGFSAGIVNQYSNSTNTLNYEGANGK
ncbi:glycosyltransferase [Serratia fonticola]|uniref:Glycosyltransferase n=1 Tax=Serratia fonticola TaxID=47917 RepID=A0AAE7VJ64_SERFO|nr:glycosyltransferase [Serratia fonticola]QXT42339.1 glycosyltransferase [Serratia fonticola]